MAHIFNYTVLTAVPDQRRGERVNVGVIVFLANRIDIRFPEIRKLRVLQNGNWERYVSDIQRMADESYSREPDPKLFINTLGMLSGVLRCSELAWFSIEHPQQYEARVDEILSALVERVRPESRPATTRLNTEISREFRRANLLAAPSEGLDARKVHRNLVVSTEDDLAADFGFRNGVTHVIATLELRREAVDKGRAAIKAITLDRAKAVFGNPRRIAVYAAPHGASQYRPHIHMLSEYADQTFNWANPDEQRSYLRSVYSAIAPPTPLISN